MTEPGGGQARIVVGVDGSDHSKAALRWAASSHGIEEHIDAMKAMVQATGGTPARIRSHPITFGSGDWTCVVGEFEDGSRMVTVAKWARRRHRRGIHLDVTPPGRAARIT